MAANAFRQLPPVRPISRAQHRFLEAQIHAHGLDRERIKDWVRKSWGAEHLTELPDGLLSELVRRLPVWAAKQEQEQAIVNVAPVAPVSGWQERLTDGKWAPF